MKTLGVIAIIGWILGAALIIAEAIIGPGPLILGVFALWAPAAIWQALRIQRGAVKVVQAEWYEPVKNPETFADAMNNLNGAFGNLARSIAGRKGPDERR